MNIPPPLPPPPKIVTIASITTEIVELYSIVPPLGRIIQVALDPFHIDNLVLEEE